MSKHIHMAVIIIVPFLISCFCSGGESKWETPPTYQGTIVAVNRHTELYKVAADSVEELPDFGIIRSVAISCKGPADALMMVGKSYIDTATSRIQSGSPLFKYRPMDDDLMLVEALNDSSYVCRMIDYAPQWNSYLFVGCYASQPGVFILDSSFALIQNCNDIVFADSDSLWGDLTDIRRRAYVKAYFLTPRQLLVSNYYETIVVDLDSGTSKRIGQRMHLVAISHDRTRFVDYTIVSESPQRHRLTVRDALTGQRIDYIDDLPWPGHCCFSPDDKVLAFTQIEGFKDIARIWMYDLDEHKLYRSEVTPPRGSSLAWIE